MENTEYGHKVLKYSVRELIWDSLFEERVLEIAEKHLEISDFNSFAYIYDKF